MDNSYYDILQVDRSASQADIKKSYKKLARETHPDKNPNNQEEAQKKFQKISEAYEVLSDEKKRKMYNQFGKDGVDGAHGIPGFSGGNPMDMFNMFRRQERVQIPVMKTVYETPISLEELYAGKKNIKTTVQRKILCKSCEGSGLKKGCQLQTCTGCNGQGMKVHVQQTMMGMMKNVAHCDQCNGKGEMIDDSNKCKHCKGQKIEIEKCSITFDIPPGYSASKPIILENQGNDIPKEIQNKCGGKRHTDLAIQINEKEHPIFKRGFRLNQGVNYANLFMELNCSLEEAICGLRQTFTFLDGNIYRFNTNKIVSSGEIMVIKGKGMPKSNGYGVGDLIVRINVNMPKKLSDKQKDIIWFALSGDKRKEFPLELDSCDMISMDDYKQTSSTPYDDSDDEDNEIPFGHGGQECKVS